MQYLSNFAGRAGKITAYALALPLAFGAADFYTSEAEASGLRIKIDIRTEKPVRKEPAIVLPGHYDARTFITPNGFPIRAKVVEKSWHNGRPVTIIRPESGLNAYFSHR